MSTFFIFSNHSFSNLTNKILNTKSSNFLQADNSTTLKQDFNTLITKTIDENLKKLHDFFSNKFNTILNAFPSSVTEASDRNITYLISQITDKNSFVHKSLYNKLSQNIKQLLLNNVANKFFINNPIDVKIPHFNYLESELKEKTKKLSQIFNFVFNTLTADEIISLSQKFVNDFISALINPEHDKTKTTNKYGMEWYTKIGTKLKPNLQYNEQFSYNDYNNIIFGLTTTTDNSSVININNLVNNLQKSVNEKLTTAYKKDEAELKEINENKTNKIQLLVDSSPQVLLNLFKPSKVANSIFQSHWNLHFTNPKFIFLNPEIQNKHKDVKLINGEIVYPNKGETNYENPITYNGILIKNNAGIKINHQFSEYNKPLQDSVKLIAGYINTLMLQNIDNYIQIKDNFLFNNLNNIDNIKPQDFIITRNFNEIKKVLNINLNFIKATVIKNSENKIVTLKYNMSLKSFDKKIINPLITYYVTINYQFPNLNEIIEYKKELIQLLPIWSSNSNIQIKNEQDLYQLVYMNKYELGYLFGFPLPKRNYLQHYKVVDFQVIKDEVVYIIQAIQHNKDAANLNKFYEIKTPIKRFLFDYNFSNAAKTEAKKINLLLFSLNKFSNPFSLTHAQITDIQRYAFFKAIGLVQKSLADKYLTNEMNKNLALFKVIYLKILNDEFAIAIKNKNIKQINEYYDNLKKDLDKSLNKTKIDPNSDFAKDLYKTIDVAKEKSLKNNQIVSNDKITKITEFIKDPTKPEVLGKTSVLLDHNQPFNQIDKLTLTSQVSFYVFGGLTILTSGFAGYFLYRTRKIDMQKYQMRKIFFLGVGVLLLLASIGGGAYFFIALLMG